MRSQPFFYTLFLALVITVSPVQAKEIRIATGEWAPYLSENLPGGGPIAQLVTEAFAQQGWSVVYTYYPWARAYSLAESAQIDATIVWAKNPERSETFNFTDPIISLENVLFTLHDKPINWENPEDLKAYRIGGVISYNYEFLDENQGYQIIRVSDPHQNYLKLKAGRIDAVIEDRLVGIGLVSEQGLAEAVTYNPKPVGSSSPHYLLVGKANPIADEIISTFNQGFQALTESGRAGELLGN